MNSKKSLTSSPTLFDDLSVPESPPTLWAFRSISRRGPWKSSPKPQIAPESFPREVSNVAPSSTKRPSGSERRGRICSGGEMVPVNETGAALGQYNPNAKWTDAEVRAVLALAAYGMPARAIARKMEMPKSTVWAIVTGRMRDQIPHDWKRRKRRG